MMTISMRVFLYILFFIYTIFFFACEHTLTPYPGEQFIEISTPQTGSVISGIVLVQCEYAVNQTGIYAELCINDSATGLTDSIVPFVYVLNTKQFKNGSILKLSITLFTPVTVPQYSKPVWVVVDNSGLSGGQIEKVLYDNNSFYITWSACQSEKFSSYNLLESTDSQFAHWQSVFYSEDRQVTQCTVNGVQPDQYRFYRLMTTEQSGTQRISGIVKASSHIKIVFASRRDGDSDIYMMNNDGSFPVNLTPEEGDQSNPRFSPDGRAIIYQSGSGIYKMDLWSGEKQSLTGDLEYAYDPQFSPDGDQIVFQSIEGNEGYIYIMNGNGTGKLKLTGNVGFEAKPKFSPGGDHLLYHTYRFPEHDLDIDIFSINIDGTNLKQLTAMLGDQSYPMYSPDGSLIVFQSYDDWKTLIYSMNSDGSNIRLLTAGVYALNDTHPIFSPDASKIIYESYQEHAVGGWGWHIYEMNLTGGAYRDLINHPSNINIAPCFSADGSRILFTSDRDGNYEVYCMNSDGSNQKNLSQNSAWDSEASFQPRP